jgi:hypothetical protein
LGLGRHGPWSGIERHQRSRVDVHQNKPAGEVRSRLSERVLASGIEDDDACLQLLSSEGSQKVGDADRVDRDVSSLRDVGVHGNNVVLAIKLKPVAGKVDRRDGVGTGRCCLVDEIPEGATKAFAVEIARAHDVEAGRLQGLRHQACVVSGRRQRACAVGRIADHKRDAPLGLLCDRRRKKPHHKQQRG